MSNGYLTEDERFVFDSIANSLYYVFGQRLQLEALTISKKQYELISNQFTKGKNHFLYESAYGSVVIKKGKKE